MLPPVPPPLLDQFQHAIAWVRSRTVPGTGIRIAARHDIPHPGVTGSFIPTLLQWGERTAALQFAGWLPSVQHPGGGWTGPEDESPSIIETAAVLLGLLETAAFTPESEASIRKGCDWLAGEIEGPRRADPARRPSTSLTAPSPLPDALLILALPPLRRAAVRWGIDQYEAAVRNAIERSLSGRFTARIGNLDPLHVPCIHALLDLGLRGEAERMMESAAAPQNEDGSLCPPKGRAPRRSGDLFQYAAVWYRLGHGHRADRAFDCARGLMNLSSGSNHMEPAGVGSLLGLEHAWTVKGFLDALTWKLRSTFDQQAATLPDSIQRHDGRYRLVAAAVDQARPVKVIEMGCGSGRFIGLLRRDYPETETFGLDFSDAMLRRLPAGISPVPGSLLNIPCDDGSFDLVFAVEALEHAVNVPAALKEMGRVLKDGGQLVIIDKNREQLGCMPVADWEQWFSPEDVSRPLRENGFTVSVIPNVPYNEGKPVDGLFLGWIATRYPADGR